MGARARRRVRDLLHVAREGAAQTLEVYRWVLGRRDKPDFGVPLADRVFEEPPQSEVST